MKTITINKFVAICNSYLSKGEVKLFTDFCKEEKYLNETESGSYEFVAEEVNKVVGSEDSINMPDTTSSLTSDKISAMYASIVEFIVNNKDLIVDNEKLTSNQLLMGITKEFASKQLTIPVSKETKENMLASFKLVDENVKMPKSSPKRTWFFKKIVLPTILTSALLGLSAGIFGATPIADNTVFNTGNAWLNFTAWATWGVVIATPLTFAFFIVKDKASRYHYSKNFCEKSNNLELLRDLEKTLGHKLTLADIESVSVNLPIKNLVEKIEKSRAKVIECNKGNWFKRNIIGFRARKEHRNQLHAMFNYAKVLRNQFEKANTQEEAERINILLDYMDKHLSTDARTNFAETATKVFENGDIYAKSIEGTRKQKVATTKVQFSNLVQRISAERYEQKEQQGMLFNLAMKKHDENNIDKIVDDLKNDNSDKADDVSVLIEIHDEDEAELINEANNENNNNAGENSGEKSDLSDDDIAELINETINSTLENTDTDEAKQLDVDESDNEIHEEIHLNGNETPLVKLLWQYIKGYDVPRQLEKLDIEQNTTSSEGEQISMFEDTDSNNAKKTNATSATNKTKKKERSTIVIDRSLKKHYKLTFTDPDGNKTSKKVKKSNNETEDVTNIGNAALEKISETFNK